MATVSQEVALWKSSMEDLYGETWREDLAELEAAKAVEVPEEGRAAAAGSAGPSGPRFRASSGAATPRHVIPPRTAGHDSPGGGSIGAGSASSRDELPKASKLSS